MRGHDTRCAPSASGFRFAAMKSYQFRDYGQPLEAIEAPTPEPVGTELSRNPPVDDATGGGFFWDYVIAGHHFTCTTARAAGTGEGSSQNGFCLS